MTDTGYSHLMVWWGAGTATFGTFMSYSLPGSPTIAMFGDFNEDGLPDAVIVDSRADPAWSWQAPIAPSAGRRF